MNKFLIEAIKEAKKAAADGEIPVGAVVVCDGKIISRGRNSREKTQIATKHAEIIAIEKACKKLGSWRLDNCEIYVSLEPCPMCAGAIANARISKLYFAAREKTSGDGLMEAIFTSTRLNHKLQYEYLPCEDAALLLTDFFKKRRKKTEI